MEYGHLGGLELAITGGRWATPESVELKRTVGLSLPGIVAKGARGFWRPLDDPDLVPQLVALAAAKPRVLVEWVRDHGSFGVHAAQPLSSAHARAGVELLEDIHAELELIARVSALHAALIAGASDDELRAITAAIPGSLFVAPSWRSIAGGARAAAATDARAHALETVGVLAGAQMSRLGARFGVALVGDRVAVRLRAEIHAGPPLTAAWAQLLQMVARIDVRPASGRVRAVRGAVRQCARCGTTFTPRTNKSAWCSPRCRWAASKAGIANPFVVQED